jgi:hypothetical protein
VLYHSYLPSFPFVTPLISAVLTLCYTTYICRPYPVLHHSYLSSLPCVTPLTNLDTIHRKILVTKG